jgi:hypothetical protein
VRALDSEAGETAGNAVQRQPIGELAHDEYASRPSGVCSYGSSVTEKRTTPLGSSAKVGLADLIYRARGRPRTRIGPRSALCFRPRSDNGCVDRGTGNSYRGEPDRVAGSHRRSEAPILSPHGQDRA